MTTTNSKTKNNMTMVPQPLQQLCNIIKAIIATNDQEAPHQKPVIDKAEATALALGIAKLMKYKSNNNNNCSIEESGELVAKHLDADFSCFLCRKKCRTRARFFLHFKRHFNKVSNSSKKSKEHHDDSLSSSDEESSDSADGFPIHLRGLSKPTRAKTAGRSRSLAKADHDGDSGCHSAGGASTSNGEATSDCLGDSESSDDESDCDAKKSQALETSVKLMMMKKKKQQKTEELSLRERLSLAEKQLDNNETEGLICLTCLKRFSNCQNLRRHLRLHIARDSIKPDFELAEDFDETDSNIDESSSGRYLCDWCPAKFDNRSAARIHESTHRGQEPKCYVCSKQYADRYSLRYHLRTHGIGRQIRCEHCNKAFSKPSRLASHVRSHHKNIRDFACPSCDKAFKTRVHLTNHFRQHSGEKPFNCPVCHEQFRHKASMISHVRKHDGERPFCCEICGKTFREPSTLKAHSRVHTGDKPYGCPDCGKSFTQRAGLNYHRKASHEGARPHACRLCPFATVKAASLSAHYRNIHQTTGEKSQLPLLTPPISGDANDATISPDKTTPLPSFHDLKTIASSSAAAVVVAAASASAASSSENDYEARMGRGQDASTPPLTPPSSSPASTTSTNPCLEDFLPGMPAEARSGHHAAAASSTAASAGDYMSSLNISELANQLDYNSGAYDYPNYRQHHQVTMYSNQQQQQLLHQQQQQQHVMHHQQQHQGNNHHHWFGYASSPHEMANNGPYSGYSNYNNYFPNNGANSANANGQQQQQAANAPNEYHHHHSMGFSSTGSYDSAYVGGATHPSYCI